MSEFLDIADDTKRFELPLPESDTEVISDARWSRMCEQYRYPDDPAELASRRTELVSAVRYMGEVGDGVLPPLTHYRVHEHHYRYFQPLGWFVILEVLLAVLAWAWLLRVVVRGHRRADEYFALRHDRLSDKLHGWIGENRAAAGMDRGVNSE